MRQQDQPNSLFVYYPVAVVPVEYWSVQKIDHSIIAQTLLKLGDIAPFRLDEVCEKLGFPVEFHFIVDQEIQQLLKEQQLQEVMTGKYKTVKKQVAVSYEYKKGYMMYDEIRGQFFTYIHEKELLMSHDTYNMEMLTSNIPLTLELYQQTSFETLLKLAVNQFNLYQEKRFTEGVADTDIVLSSHLEDEANEEINTMIRVEKQPYPFVKRGYIAVQLTGMIMQSQSGELYTKVSAISPFTDDHSVQLYELIKGQDVGEEAIRLVELMAKEAELQSFGSSPNEQQDTLANIETMLQGAQVSDALYEYLQTCERDYLRYKNGNGEKGDRASSLNTFGLMAEALLQEHLEPYIQIEPILVKKSWLLNGHVNRKALKADFYTISDHIPQAIWCNLEKLAEKMNRYGSIQNVHYYGSRDYVATLLISDYLGEKSFYEKVLQHPQGLTYVEDIVAIRNKLAGHHSGWLMEMQNKKFIELFTELRESMYAFIRFMEEK